MEAEDSPDVQSASCGQTQDHSVWFQPQSKGLRTRAADAVGFSLRAGSLETQEEPKFHFESKSRKRPMALLETSGRRNSLLLQAGQMFYFIQVLNGLDKCYSH